jgi:hypothetical protein
MYSQNSACTRILIQSFSSFQWQLKDDHAMARFLFALGNTLKQSRRGAVCFLTVPAHAFQRIQRLQLTHLVDYLIEVKSFSDEQSPYAKEYHGKSI